MRRRTRIVPRHPALSDTVFGDPVFWVFVIAILAVFMFATWLAG